MGVFLLLRVCMVMLLSHENRCIWNSLYLDGEKKYVPAVAFCFCNIFTLISYILYFLLLVYVRLYVCVAHGEEDFCLRRGKPLFLSTSRLKQLHKMWAQNSQIHESSRHPWPKDAKHY